METPQPPAPPPLPPMPHHLSYLPQHVITSGTRRDCVRLRGLPYEASVEHILEFLGEYAKNIVFQGVHMVYNAQVCARRVYFSNTCILSREYARERERYYIFYVQYG